MLVSLATLIAQLEADEALGVHALAHRDRGIGKRLSPDLSPTDRLRAWLDVAATAAARNQGETVGHLARLTVLGVIAIGLLAGVAAALAVFSYDGSRPINVINVLGVYVAVQLVLLAVFLFLCLPAPLLNAFPGLDALRSTLAPLNPGRWGLSLLRQLNRRHGGGLTQLSERVPGRLSILAPVGRWLAAGWSQTFAIAFNAGSLATALYLVTTSDLAFGWSTTLDVSAGAITRLTEALAWPWRSWLPQAVPGSGLVEASRYFRLDEGLLPAAQPPTGPAVLGAWWPFLAMCMFVYGLAPRLITWWLAGHRRRRAIRSAMLHLPGVPETLDRLDLPLVETAATEDEVAGTSPEPAPSATAKLAPGRYVMVDWAETVGDRPGALAALGAAGEEVLAAGGARSPAADAELIRMLSKRAYRSPILVTVPAWEPPMLELVDFLTDLRGAIGADRRIIVLPLMRGDAGRTVLPPATGDYAMWRARIARLGDPATCVMLAGAPAS